MHSDKGGTMQLDIPNLQKRTRKNFSVPVFFLCLRNLVSPLERPSFHFQPPSVMVCEGGKEDIKQKRGANMNKIAVVSPQWGHWR
jgi:hypothetical protein